MGDRRGDRRVDEEGDEEEGEGEGEEQQAAGGGGGGQNEKGRTPKQQKDARIRTAIWLQSGTAGTVSRPFGSVGGCR